MRVLLLHTLTLFILGGLNAQVSPVPPRADEFGDFAEFEKAYLTWRKHYDVNYRASPNEPDTMHLGYSDRQLKQMTEEERRRLVGVDLPPPVRAAAEPKPADLQADRRSSRSSVATDVTEKPEEKARLDALPQAPPALREKPLGRQSADGTKIIYTRKELDQLTEEQRDEVMSHPRKYEIED